MQAKLAEGVNAERLRKAIEHVEVRLECDPHPQVRRLMVRTPLTKGADSAATFDGGAVAIAVSGASVRNAAGNPEAGSSRKQPVTIRITGVGGKTAEIEGVLPQQQMLAAGDREYRLSIAAASRGFAQATVEHCRIPDRRAKRRHPLARQAAREGAASRSASGVGILQVLDDGGEDSADLRLVAAHEQRILEGVLTHLPDLAGTSGPEP